jgi:hypothetical protein
MCLPVNQNESWRALLIKKTADAVTEGVASQRSSWQIVISSPSGHYAMRLLSWRSMPLSHMVNK